MAEGATAIAELRLVSALCKHLKFELETDWDEVILPLLCTLCAVQEHVSLDVLCNLARLTATHTTVQLLLEQHWRSFLSVEEGTEVRYRLDLKRLDEATSHLAIQEISDESDRALVDEISAGLRRAHNAIVEHYLTAWGGLEHNLPGLSEPSRRDIDRGYGLRHIAVHLARALRSADLHKLLRLEQPSPHQPRHYCWPRHWRQTSSLALPLWYTVREQAGDKAGYIRDIALAWQVTDQRDYMPSEPGEPVGEGAGAAIGLQCRYALIMATLNSVETDIPVAEEQPQQPAEVLINGHQLQTAGTLAALSVYLAGADYLRQTLAAIQMTRDSEAQAGALLRLASHLPLVMLPTAFRIAWSIQASDSRTKALAELALYLPGPFLRIALIMIQSEPDWRTLEAPFTALLLRLVEDDRPQEALEVVWTIGEPQRRRRQGFLAFLVSCLARSGYPSEALVAARTIDDVQKRIEVLGSLSIRLAALGYPEAALTAVRNIPDPYLSMVFQADLVSHLVDFGWPRTALTAAQTIRDRHLRFEILNQLVPHLAWSGYPQEALAAAHTIPDRYQRRELFGQLAVDLAHLGYPQEALAAAQALPFDRERANALEMLAPYLPGPLLHEALALTKHLWWGRTRISAQTALIISLMLLDNPQEALKAVRELPVKDELLGSPQAEVLIALAPYLPGPLLHEALTIAQSIAQEPAKMAILTNILPRLARLGYSQEALVTACALPVEGELLGSPRTEALATLVPYLSEPQLREALTVALAFPRKWMRARVLAQAAPQLAVVGDPQGALALVRAIRSPDTQAEALTGLVTHLPESLLEEAIALAYMLRQASALLPLALRLADLSQPRKALAALNAIESDAEYVEAAIVLIPHLVDLGYQAEVLAVAQTHGLDEGRVEVLEALAGYQPPLDEHEALDAMQESEQTEAQNVSNMPSGSTRRRMMVAEPGLPSAWDGIQNVRARELEVLDLCLATLAFVPKVFVTAWSFIYRRLFAKSFGYLAMSLAVDGHPQEALTMVELVGFQSMAPEILAIISNRLAKIGSLREALTLARVIPDQHLRTDCFIVISRRLAYSGYSQDALAVMHEVQEEEQLPVNIWVEAMEELVPYLAEPQMRAALAMAEDLPDTEAQSRVQMALTIRLAVSGYVQEALAIVEVMTLESARGAALAKLAPYLVEPQVRVALVIAEAIHQEDAHAEALAELASQLAVLGFVQEALAVVRGIEITVERTRALERLAPALTLLPYHVLYPLWAETLHILCCRTRHALLADLAALAQVIAHLGSTAAIVETFQAIQDTSRWCP